MKNLINIILFLFSPKVRIKFKNSLLIEYGSSSISISEDRIEFNTDIQRFNYNYSFSNCEDWFVNSSPSLREEYLNNEDLCLEPHD